MKTATLIAIIAMALDTLGSIYWLLIDFRALPFNEMMASILRPLYLLSNAGLLVFFIILYQKQSKN